ncbi:DUF5330 domain-containing protein [Rhodobium gokarnense]|uniref:DUF5330 domain-containing protein n=1 Tax=Rhodobium gokarnense TaxID=364296 RepID=A0ABT3HC17_9HYPH|nr:DUF5330 domain-containing protein [Rhodobium gokarnense]MCW2307915.1 hypothetical protein [Rhodobium gokarnense]
MFLIRTAFWLTLLLVILPIDVETNDAGQQPQISTFEAIGAASSVINDFSHFCDRNEAACATGGAAIKHVGQKAKAGARMVYEYLDGNLDETPDANAAPDGAAGDTLTASDRQPAWRTAKAEPSA